MTRRPAEATGGLAGAATLIAAAAGAPTLAVAIAGATAGILPGVVTWLVHNGGLRGALRALWRGEGGAA